MLLPTNTDYSLWRSNSSVLCLTSSVKRSDCLRKMAKHGANSSVLCPTYILRYLCKYISCLHDLVTNFQSECPCSSHSSHPCSKCKSVSFAFKFLQDFWANCKAYSYALCTIVSHCISPLPVVLWNHHRHHHLITIITINNRIRRNEKLNHHWYSLGRCSCCKRAVMRSPLHGPTIIQCKKLGGYARGTALCSSLLAMRVQRLIWTQVYSEERIYSREYTPAKKASNTLRPPL